MIQVPEFTEDVQEMRVENVDETVRESPDEEKRGHTHEGEHPIEARKRREVGGARDDASRSDVFCSII